MTMFWAIVLQIVLIFLNAVFAAAEIAVISFNENKLKKLADDGNKKCEEAHLSYVSPDQVPLDDTGRDHARGLARKRVRGGLLRRTASGGDHKRRRH